MSLDGPVGSSPVISSDEIEAIFAVFAKVDDDSGEFSPQTVDEYCKNLVKECDNILPPRLKVNECFCYCNGLTSDSTLDWGIACPPMFGGKLGYLSP